MTLYATRCALALILLNLLWACANIGRPEGGPYDTKPPRLVEASPTPRSTNVTKKRIRLSFDEYIKLAQQDKVIVSPPQIIAPTITATGKDITIIFNDSLRPETTYSLYFDDAIVDNNEDNALEGFAYTFSTGSTIDTMQMSGVVLDALTLEPVGGLVIGAYYAKDITDSIARTQAFPFASKTSKMGRFALRGLRDSAYYVYALRDDDNDYRYNGASEGFAFDDRLLRTTKLDSMRTDTIRIDSIVRRDTLHRDSLVTYSHTYYRPDDIVLRYFVPANEQRGLDKYSRIDSAICRVDFLQAPTALPSLRSLDKPSIPSDSLYLPVREDRGIAYWLRDEELMQKDSIRFALDYERTDSLMHLEQVTDTLTFYKPRQRPQQSKQTAASSPLQLTFSGSRGAYRETPHDSLSLLTNIPLSDFPLSAIKLEETIDSTTTPIPYSLQPDSTNGLRLYLEFERKFGASYQAQVDSGAIHSIYGHPSSVTKFEQKVLPENELGALELRIKGLDTPEPIIAELLNKSGNTLMSLPLLRVRTSSSSAPADTMLSKLLIGGQSMTDTIAPSSVLELKLSDLRPDEYYVRIYIDSNADGLWTTGHYPDRQPEMVYYSPVVYSVKKGFTTSEEWAPLEHPLDRQKPEALRKTKPEAKKEKVDKNIEYYRKQRSKSSPMPAGNTAAGSGLGSLGSALPTGI